MSKSFNNIVDKARLDARHDDERRNLLIFFLLKRFIKADYLTFRAKNAFKSLQNIFI